MNYRVVDEEGGIGDSLLEFIRYLSLRECTFAFPFSFNQPL